MAKSTLQIRWWQGWTRFHLLIVGLVAALAFGAGLRGVMVISSGGWTAEATVIVPHEALDIWPLVISHDARVKWEAGVHDIIRMTKDSDVMGSTRQLYMKNEEESWSFHELTEKLVPGRLFQAHQKSQKEVRRLKIEMESAGRCLTRITYKIRAEPKTYAGRYWALLGGDRKEQRLVRSLEALAYWADKDLPACKTE